MIDDMSANFATHARAAAETFTDRRAIPVPSRRRSKMTTSSGPPGKGLCVVVVPLDDKQHIRSNAWEFIDFPNGFESLPTGGATEPDQTEQDVNVIASWFRWCHQVMWPSIEHNPSDICSPAP